MSPEDRARERLFALTEGLPPSFWPQEAREIWRWLWERLKGVA